MFSCVASAGALTTCRTWAMAKGTGSCEWSPNSTGVEWSPVTTMLQGRVDLGTHGRGCVGSGTRGSAARLLHVHAGQQLRPHRPCDSPGPGAPVLPVAAPLLLPQQAHQLAHHLVHHLLVPGLQGSSQGRGSVGAGCSWSDSRGACCDTSARASPQLAAGPHPLYSSRSRLAPRLPPRTSRAAPHLHGRQVVVTRVIHSLDVQEAKVVPACRQRLGYGLRLAVEQRAVVAGRARHVEHLRAQTICAPWS